jgi:hypothetical protein
MTWDLLHPGMWPLVLLAGVPLLVHLISKRRARDVRFGPMEFVLRSQRRSARRIQLRQWLLLLARTLVVLFAVVAILGPLRRPTTPTPGTERGTRHVLAVDVTMSMAAKVDGVTALQRALEQARAMVRGLKAEEPVAVVACGQAPMALLEPPGFDRAVVEEALGRVVGTLEGGDLPSCLARARVALGGDGAGRITLFTDAARHAWPAGARVDLGGAALEVVRPFADAVANVAVAGLKVVPAPDVGARAITVETAVEGFGLPDGAEVMLTLLLDGTEAARGSVTLGAGGVGSRRFSHVLPREAPVGSVHTVEVRSVPDALVLDDVLALPVKAPRELTVLVVDGDPQTVAWRDEVFYLERALAAPPKNGGAFHMRVLTAAPTAADVDAADVVLLCNVRSVPREVVTALERHVRRGGGLFISGGDRVDVDFYNGALGALLPQPLRGEKSRAELDGTAQKDVMGLGQLETAHAIFAPFNGERPEGLVRAQTHTWLLMEPTSRTERTVLMRFSNGAPALLERQVGAGRVMVWTTTVDRDWSDLAIRPGFLPLMQQVVLYLADALEDGRARSQPVLTPRVIPLPRGVVQVAVVNPEGATVAVPVAAVDTEVSLPAPVALGIHQVLMGPKDGSPVEVPQERFSAWPNAMERDLGALTEADIEARLPAGATLLAGGGGGGAPVPLWPVLLILLQLAWMAEGLLARRG